MIQEKLPYVNLKVRKFPARIPNSPIGLYTLTDEKTMIASARTSSSVPAGQIVFEEDHENPPSRAYLKIQESLAINPGFVQWLGLLLVCFILPGVICWGLGKLLRQIGWINDGDLALE